jgi:hypothetical protein
MNPPNLLVAYHSVIDHESLEHDENGLIEHEIDLLAVA